MNAEYQRLQDVASGADGKIRQLEQNGLVGSTAELFAMERRMDEFPAKHASLVKAV